MSNKQIRRGDKKGNRRKRGGREQPMPPATMAIMAERKMKGTIKRQVK
jgi:hypothetical protein